MGQARQKSRTADGAGGKPRKRVWWLLAAGCAAAALIWISIRHDAPVAAVPAEQATVPRFPPVIPGEKETFAAYGGSESCKSCHQQAYDKWIGSNHQLAEREWKNDMDRKAFDPPQEIAHATQKSRAEPDPAGGGRLVTRGADGGQAPYHVSRIIGNDPLRQCLVEARGGRLQTSELAWDPKRCEWFDVYGNEDRQPGEWGHWSGRGMTWNTMCAACHNTRLRKDYDAKSDAYHTVMAEPSVGCEACHGPMKDHVVFQEKKPPKGTKDPTIRKFEASAMIDTCGACHARRAELTGDLVPGTAFHDHFSLVLPDASDIYYPDGQVRDEDYEYAAFVGSKMYSKGVRCIDCHDPHTAKRILPGNMLCMRCHIQGGNAAAPVIDPVAHGFHGDGKPSNDCTGCHMPVTNYMQRHPRHDHGMSIPDPLLTKEFGIPNACNRCHADKDADWALAECEKRYGDKMKRPTRDRAILFAKARRGDADASEGLMAFLSSDMPPSWKASACLLLGRWVSDAQVLAVLRGQLKHDSPLVREAAVRSLEPLVSRDRERAALRPLLEDSSRAVRMAAAWALKDKLDMDSPAGRELEHMLEISSDQPAGRMRLGQFLFARGDKAGGIVQVRKAVEWDPRSPPFHHDLALMLSDTGDRAGAIRELQEAVKLDPKEPEFHYKLALAWNEAGSVPHAAASLEETVKLDPSHARAWYNLGLARSALEKPAEAITAFEKAEKADPSDSSFPYARATVLARMGRKKEAVSAAARALALKPDFAEAKELLQELGVATRE